MPRRKRNFQRKVDTKEPRQRFLIVCEGKTTEPNYFESFRVPRNVIEIDIQGLGKNPSELVDKAIRMKDNEEYDQVWCVFDRDSWSAQDFNNAIERARQQKIKVAYSNEAFELWYVLHFHFLNTGVSRNDYCQILTKSLGKEYQKNSETIYDELFDKQLTAIKNAENLLTQYNTPNPASDNPSTTVHLLVLELNKFIT